MAKDRKRLTTASGVPVDDDPNAPVHSGTVHQFRQRKEMIL
jgi:hypothetical protein